MPRILNIKKATLNCSREECERKLALLTNPNWTTKEIMAYTNCQKSKACDIKNEAELKFNGAVNVAKSMVSCDSVLRVLGTTRYEEVSILRKIGGIESGNLF